MKLSDLAIDHDYYCSDSNYYTNEVQQDFETMTDFLEEFNDADEDLNLCFRWDVREKEDEDGKKDGTYSAEVFLILQRKGIFKPCSIKSFGENEVEGFISYLQKHKNKLNKIWNPIS